MYILHCKEILKNRSKRSIIFPNSKAERKNQMNKTGKNKFDLDTPCLVLDMDLLERNLATMQHAVREAEKNIRPHVKTHKCSALAKKQIEAGAIGVCAAKLTEAEALAEAGISNILITAPVVTQAKMERLVNLAGEDPTSMVVVDNAETITLLDAASRQRNLTLDVLLDLNVGLDRTGVKPSDAAAVAEHIGACHNLRLRGVQAYAGHVQHIHSYEKRKETSLHALKSAAKVFRDLEAAYPDCIIFSASGTGTFDIDCAIPELTELQVGSYAVMDAEYLAVGSEADETRFRPFEPALRLLTTVISIGHSGFVTVDAGLKTLYKDGAVPQVITPEYRSLTYDWFGDEYGKISGPHDSDLPPLGSVLELITSHCDPTINLFDNVYLTRGEKVIGTWEIDLRGCSS
jgi:D-serine deaminase-like pyridoxal phosphate-dependent protein